MRYERVERLVRPGKIGFAVLAAIFSAPSAEVQDASKLVTINQRESLAEGGAPFQLGTGTPFDTPRWQREVVASLLEEVISSGSLENPGIEVCDESVHSAVSVGAEACVRSSSSDGTQGSLTVLKGLFSNERESAPLAVGGRAITAEWSTEYSALARVNVSDSSRPLRVEFEYTKISNGEIYGQPFEGGEWRSVRAVIGDGAWDMLGNGQGETGLSVSLRYEQFKASSLSLERLEENVPLDISDIYLGALPSRTFTAPGLKRDEGEGVTLKVKYQF